MKIEQTKKEAKTDKANPEQLFEEVVTEIVDRRMKMEENENKDEASRGFPWLIGSLKEKQKKTGNLPVETGRRKFRSHPRTTARRKAMDNTNVSRSKIMHLRGLAERPRGANPGDYR